MKRLPALVVVFAFGAIAAEAAPRPDVATTRTQRIETAVAAAATHVWAAHRGDHWAEAADESLPRDHGGRTALCVYALLAAGESYQSETMARTIRWLCAVDTQSVYVRSMRVMALAELPAQPAGSPVARTLAADTQWLLDAARPDGAYDYVPAAGSGPEWDNSNTQMAHLAVWAAAQRGVAVGEAYWRRAEQHWRRTQTGAGGWSYGSARKPAYGSMSAAALASLLQCYDELHRDATIRPGADADWTAIERGLDWLAEHFAAGENPGRGPQYYHYYVWAVERVGAASGYKYLGPHDWFVEIADELLRTQGPNGGWGNWVDTCFALAFLARGRAPILVSKLSYNGLWNPRPRDMANLTRWLSRRFERPVRWQVLDVRAPAAQWHDGPILYISGASVPRFEPDQLAKLRDFVARGGMIVSEAAGSSPAFNVEMRKVYRRLVPDRPLEPLEPTHPLFAAHRPLAAPPKLVGISNGVRLLAVHSPTDLSKAWHMRQVKLRGDTFQLAANLYVHATDFGEFRRRAEPFAQLWPPEPTDTDTFDRVIGVARLSHAGNSDPEPMAYRRLAALMAQRHATRLRFDGPMPIADLPAATHPIALMTGTADFTLSGADKLALRAFINAGGLLVVDSAGGGDTFTAAVRRELLPILDDTYPRISRLSPQSPIYRLPGLEIESVRFRRASRVRYTGDRAPRLEAVVVENHVAIIFSPLDLTAGLVGYRGHNLRGYAPTTAFQLMRNLLLYAAGRPRPDKPVLKGFVDVEWGEEEE